MKDSSNNQVLDVIIIGGGPTGINCGIAACDTHLDYLILEKGVLVNSIFNFPANMTFFSTSKNLEIGNVPFISHVEKPTRKEALEYYRRIIEAYDLNIFFQHKVIQVNKDNSVFTVQTNNGKTFYARNIIVATGFYDHARMLNVPGEKLPKVKHYYDEVHHYIRSKVAVVGGANSACDVALECYHKGAEVTMIVREKELYPKVKYWILPNVKNRIAEGSIKAYFSSEITEIRQNEVDIITPDGPVTIENDYVLAMTGYHPDYNFFKSIGIQLGEDQAPVFDSNTLETNISGLYVAGVIVGGDKTSSLFIENTRHHADVIIQDIISKKS